MIALEPYRIPLRVPYRWGKGAQHERCGLIVRIELDGATGWGEVAPPIQETFVPSALAMRAAEIVKGLCVADERFLTALDARRPDPSLRCGIATAWLAARAARDGMSLSAYLAGPEKVPAAIVPVNALITDASAEDAASRAAEFTAAGFRTLKIKCTADRAGNRARVAAVRAAAPFARLRLDANESWDPTWALSHLEELASYDIEYVEQPLPSGLPLDAHVAFRKASAVRVALDESANELDAITAILRARAADVIILKTQAIGGPDRARDAICRASEAGVRVTVTVSLETAIGTATALHVASLLPNPVPDCGLALGRFLESDVGEAPAVADGRMAVPGGGGLGIEVFDSFRMAAH